MDARFPNWLRSTDLEVTSDIAEKRWKTIERLAKRADRTQVMDFINVFFGNKGASATTRSAIVSAAQKDDAAFGDGRNDHEVRVLAGAISLHVASRNIGDLEALALLGFEANSFQGVLTEVPSVELLNDAISQLAEKRTKARAAYNQTQSGAPFDQISVPDDLAQARDQGQPAEYCKQLDNFLQNVVKEVNKERKRNNAVSAALALQREELEMLWWIYTGYSDVVDGVLAELELAERALVVGVELAARTIVPPGPLAAKTLAAFQMGAGYSSDAEVTLSGLYGALNSQLVAHVAEYPGGEIPGCCLLSCLAKLVHEYPEVDIESDAFGQSIGLSGAYGVGYLQAAMQVYDEILIRRVMSDA